MPSHIFGGRDPATGQQYIRSVQTDGSGRVIGDTRASAGAIPGHISSGIQQEGQNSTSSNYSKGTWFPGTPSVSHWGPEAMGHAPYEETALERYEFNARRHNAACAAIDAIGDTVQWDDFACDLGRQANAIVEQIETLRAKYDSNSSSSLQRNNPERHRYLTACYMAKEHGGLHAEVANLRERLLAHLQALASREDQELDVDDEEAEEIDTDQKEELIHAQFAELRERYFSLVAGLPNDYEEHARSTDNYLFNSYRDLDDWVCSTLKERRGPDGNFLSGEFDLHDFDCGEIASQNDMLGQYLEDLAAYIETHPAPISGMNKPQPQPTSTSAATPPTQQPAVIVGGTPKSAPTATHTAHKSSSGSKPEAPQTASEPRAQPAPQGKTTEPTSRERPPVYQGQMLNGERHGDGTLRWSSGHCYQGSWLNGKRHGEGCMTWPDGSYYWGDWVDDKRHGVGTQTGPRGENPRSGKWVDDKPVT